MHDLPKSKAARKPQELRSTYLTQPAMVDACWDRALAGAREIREQAHG